MTGPFDRDAPDNQTCTRAASGRPAGAGATTYGTAALQLLDQGYLPLPLRPGQKSPAVKAWTTVPIDYATVTGWARQFPDHGVGLRCGHLVGLDIDVLDPDLSFQLCQRTFERFGEAPLRVGRWPKRLLLYRTEVPFAKIECGTGKGSKLEVLGHGQQLVAFGRHPETGSGYFWPLGETRSRSRRTVRASSPTCTQSGSLE